MSWKCPETAWFLGLDRSDLPMKACRLVSAQLPATGPFGNVAPTGSDFAPLDTGRRIGKYRLVYPVGEGGMSVVYLAQDEVLDRKVAIKILHRHLAKDPEARARFSREARAVARLAHRNIPEIYDFSDTQSGPNRADGTSQPDGPSYLVTEFIDGAPLSRILREGPPLPPELGVVLTLGVARALVHAHSQSVVHRDVKPENVLVGKDGVVKLTDFGIAQIRGLESMTMTGTLIGSPAHMAPEQIETAKDIDARADVWGLGTVLYMAVTGGKLPFEADNPHRLLKKIVDGHYTDPRRLSPHVDAALSNIIAMCLEVDREVRYQTVAELEAHLTAWLAPRGFNDHEAELRAYMADPEGTTRVLATRLSTVMMGLGDEALARGERSVALEHFGRVLALDPEREDALERVRKLEKQLRTRRGARSLLIGVVGAGALAAAAWAVVAVATREPPPRPAPVIVNARALGRASLPATPPKLDPVVEPPMLAGSVFGDVLGRELVRSDATVAELARLAEAQREADEKKERETKKKNTPVPVMLTVYPPAVRIEVDGLAFVAGKDTPLLPGRHRVTLTHTGCPDCVPEVRWLVVPEVDPSQATPTRVTQHYDVERKAEQFPPAKFQAECSDGSYVKDPNGRRFECNRVYKLPVRSEAAELIQLTAYSADDKPLRTMSFRLSPNQSIVWPL